MEGSVSRENFAFKQQVVGVSLAHSLQFKDEENDSRRDTYVYLSRHKSCLPRDGIWTGHRCILNAFYRMASRRGLPEEIYSDNSGR